MSTLKNILEKYKAKGEDEQNFMDKHTDNVQVTDAPGKKEHDEATKKMKMAPRERKGYNPDEDSEVYEGYYSLADISSVLFSIDLSEDQIDHVINTLQESSPSKMVSLIDEAVREFYEESTDEEKKILDEMLQDDAAYEEFITSLFEEDITSTEDDDSEEDEDEDDDTEELDMPIKK
jgi:hypothetical protein